MKTVITNATRSINQCLFTGSSSITPVVFNVSPQFGPVAGGTLVTISGPRLNYAGATVALYPVVIQLIKANNSR
jgi:hypothetical protein